MALAESVGFEVNREALHSMLMGHQSDIAQWAIKGGRRAINPPNQLDLFSHL